MARRGKSEDLAAAPRTRVLLNADRLAFFFNLSKSRVFQLVHEGLPKELRGKYDLDKCYGWYVRYLQAALEKKAIPIDGQYASEREERLRNLRADADLKEIELARERGLLVAIDDVEKEMTELVLTTKARVMAVAPRLAPEILGETSRVMAQAKIEKALKDALLHLAQKETVAREKG